MSDSNDINLSRFNPVWQDAIFGWMIKDDVFFDKCKVQVKYSWFTDPSIGELANLAYKFADGFGRSPTREELIGVVNRKHTDKQTQEKYRLKLEECITRVANVGLDVIKVEMTDWIKACLLKSGMESIISLYNKKEPIGKIESKLTILQDEVQVAGFEGDDDGFRFDDPFTFFEKQAERKTDRCTLGHPDFDAALVSDSRVDVPATRTALSDYWVDSTKQSSGSLTKGDTTCFIGPVNTGKTRTLITIVCANIVNGKDVILMTHEQQKNDIRQLIYSCMAGLTFEQCKNARSNPIHSSRLIQVGQLLQEHLLYVSYMKVGMYSEDVISLLQSKQRERQKRNGGKGFDLIVDDYPGKLRSRIAMSAKNDMPNEIKMVYNSFVELGNSIGTHIVVAAQINREGIKAMRKEQRILDMDSISGSFGVPQDMANVITINQFSPDTLLYFIAKTRDNRKHSKFQTLTRLDICRPYHPFQPAQFGGPETTLQSLTSSWNGILAQSKCGSTDGNAVLNATKTYQPVVSVDTVPIETPVEPPKPGVPLLHVDASYNDYYAQDNGQVESTTDNEYNNGFEPK